MFVKPLVACLLFATVLLVSCTTLEVGVESTPTADPAALQTAIAESVQATVQAQSVTPPATETPAPSEPTPAAIPPTATPGQQPASTTSAPSALFTGLIYRLGDQLLQVGPDGDPVALVPGLDPELLPGQFTPRAAVSSDGKQLISWWDWSDLWSVDLTSGETRNLTNTPDHPKCCAQFWPGQPDTVIFLTRLGDEGLSYTMAAVNLDGSNYRLLDESAALMGLPALSPDGRTIAYDPEGKPWLYGWESGPQALNLAEFNLQIAPERSYGLTNPAWSPSGKEIAWMVSGDPFGSGAPQGGVVVLNFPGKTHRLLNPYEPVGAGGGLLPPVWSPDGSWLVVFEQSLSQPGAWVMHPDGSARNLVYAAGTVRSVPGLQAIWSPDSQHLLIVDPNAEGRNRLTLVNLLANRIEDAGLPVGAIPLAWVE